MSQLTDILVFPESIFAEISCFLGDSPEGDLIRQYTGKIAIRHDIQGNTYKNGLLHSYDDKPALVEDLTNVYYPQYNAKRFTWYKNGKIHREGDKPAKLCGKEEILNLFLKRSEQVSQDLSQDLSQPLIEPTRIELEVESVHQEWWKDGFLHREGDKPAIRSGCLYSRSLFAVWYKNGKKYRDGNKPVLISGNVGTWIFNGKEINKILYY